MRKIIVQYAGFRSVFKTEFTLAGEFERTHKDIDILEIIWAGFNAGSGNEFNLFRFAHIRSMSVDDFVKIDDKWYRCASFGWDESNEDEMLRFVEETKRRIEKVERPAITA